MATCGRCGAISTDETAAFCGSCGAPLKNAGAPPSPAPVPAPDAPSGPVEGEPEREGGLGPPPGAPAEPGPAPPHGTIPGEPLSSALKPAPPAGAPRDKPFTAPKHLPAGTLIDKKYAVLRVLGEGGMGVVYLARDIHTGLDVVVKAVRSELAHRDDVRARTLAEGRALAQIDHPNVVHLRAVAVEGPHLYLVMQYIEGESLDRIIARHVQQGEPMPVDVALGIFRQVASGVGAAHGEGVIHRDLKPANVLLRKKDKVAKVTDFGIALVPSDTSRPQTRGILGSLWYMSPEQVTGRRDLDQRVDVYALGIMLYQMLVGRVPFDAKSDYDIMKLHAEAPMPLASATRPDVPPSVDDLIQKACAKNRDLRFQHCAELCAAVERILYPPPPPTLREVQPGLTPAIPLVALPGTPSPKGSRPTLVASSPGQPVAMRRSPHTPGGAPGVAPTAEEPPPALPVRRRKAPWIVLGAGRARRRRRGRRCWRWASCPACPRSSRPPAATPTRARRRGSPPRGARTEARRGPSICSPAPGWATGASSRPSPSATISSSG